MAARKARYLMMDNPRIFGTPPEPVFNMKGCCLSSSLLEELLVVLAAGNEKELQRVSPNCGLFKCGSLVECIFIICDRLKQPPETRYIAAELFDRFIRAHVINLKQRTDSFPGQVKHPKTSSSLSLPEWKHALRKLCKQMLAFMVSCVQIASKLCSHYNIVTCRNCAEILQEKGHRYSINKVLTSELLVMKTLDYNLHVPNPLSYVETLLEIMGHNDPGIQVKVLHETCLRVLDISYMKRKQVYERLLKLAVGDSPVNSHTRAKFAGVENDLMLLATASVGAAAYFTDMSITDKVNDHLARITRIPIDDMTDFSSVIISLILE